MSAGHTPGPWDAPKPTMINKKAWSKLHFDGPMQFVTVGWDGFSGETIAIVYGDDDDQEISNARLIAAAPDLLEALQDAYAELLADSTRDGPRCLLLTQIEAAIAKATGGEQ